METWAVIFVAAVGLVFGSFLNVCIARLPRHESIVKPRSRCPHCEAAIAARDNIPVLSFLLLQGRCRTCHKTIAWRYPAIELATAALWLLCWLQYGPILKALGMAILAFLLLGLAAMDAETMRLPDAFTLPGIVLGIIYSGGICSRWARCAVLSASWAATAAGILLAVSGLYWLLRKREGVGMGDVKLIALIAAWLGPSTAMLSLFLGVIAAALYGIGISISRRRLNGAARLPFGAFLCAAALYAAFQGRHLIHWYMGFFR
jgi:leader peptidase (prepilin peptidase)/N-methyltransferase